MKTLIIYESTHHGNTYKLVDAIKQKYSIDLLNIADDTADKKVSWDSYDLIGIASGIDFGKFYPKITAFVRENMPAGKNVFLLYTCGNKSDKYVTYISTIIRSAGSQVIGSYGSLGLDTYGPFKVMGGISKGHPTAAEIENAVKFYESLTL